MRHAFRIGSPTPERYRIGPLGPYIDPLAVRLSEFQYARETARHKIRVVADLSRWLERRRLDVGSLDDRLIIRFFRGRRGYDPMRCGDMAAVGSVFQLLRDLGVLPEPPQEEGGSPQHFTEIAFEQYLKQERGCPRRCSTPCPSCTAFLSTALAPPGLSRWPMCTLRTSPSSSSDTPERSALAARSSWWALCGPTSVSSICAERSPPTSARAGSCPIPVQWVRWVPDADPEPRAVKRTLGSAWAVPAVGPRSRLGLGEGEAVERAPGGSPRPVFVRQVPGPCAVRRGILGHHAP